MDWAYQEEACSLKLWRNFLAAYQTVSSLVQTHVEGTYGFISLTPQDIKLAVKFIVCLNFHEVPAAVVSLLHNVQEPSNVFIVGL